MWFQLLLVVFIRVVDIVLYLRDNSSEVNIETILHESLTCLHIFDAEVLINLCSGTISSHAYCAGK